MVIVKTAQIPKILTQHINNAAFTDDVCLIGTVLLPSGFAQVTPRGSTMVFNDEHIHGIAAIHKSGQVYKEVWNRLIQPERERDPEKKGFAF
jgi:hypothetical protein